MQPVNQHHSRCGIRIPQAQHPESRSEKVENGNEKDNEDNENEVEVPLCLLRVCEARAQVQFECIGNMTHNGDNIRNH